MVEPSKKLLPWRKETPAWSCISSAKNKKALAGPRAMVLGSFMSIQKWAREFCRSSWASLTMPHSIGATTSIYKEANVFETTETDTKIVFTMKMISAVRLTRRNWTLCSQSTGSSHPLRLVCAKRDREDDSGDVYSINPTGSQLSSLSLVDKVLRSIQLICANRVPKVQIAQSHAPPENLTQQASASSKV